MCDGSGRLLRGVVCVRADRTDLVDSLRQENEAVTGWESTSVAVQDKEITRISTDSTPTRTNSRALRGSHSHNTDCWILVFRGCFFFFLMQSSLWGSLLFLVKLLLNWREKWTVWIQSVQFSVLGSPPIRSLCSST